MRIRTLLICLWYLFLNCQYLKATGISKNSFHVIGQVIDSVNNAQLSFAAITVKGKMLTSLTNENGYFEIDVPYDTSTLIATFVGYSNKEINLAPQTIKEILLIKLSKQNTEIAEVTIVTQKEKIIRVPSDAVSAVMMSPKLIAKLPNLGEVDVMRSFQLLPGISGSNESSSGLYVRGGTPDQNLILFDGMTIYHVDHFFGFFSAFNANTIDDIELMKGGFPAIYGGRLSSVMEISGKQADLGHFHAGAGISLLSGNAYLETPIIKDKLSFQFAARRSYSDIIQTGLYNKIFNLYNQTTTTNIPSFGNGGRGFGGGRRFSQQQTVTPTFHFYDINSKVIYKPTSKDEIILSIYNGEDKLDQSRSLSSGFTRNSSSGTLTDITDWGNTGISSQWKRKWVDDFNSHIFISYSNYFNITDRELNSSSSGAQLNARQAFDNANVRNNIEDITFRFKNQWKITQNQQFSFGTEITHNGINYSGFRSDTLIVNSKANLYSYYLQDNFDVTKKIHFTAGYRGSYFHGTLKYYSEPRASLIYNVTDDISFKSAVGKYYQFISCVTQEDILTGNSQYWLLDNNTNVPVSSAIHYIAGFSFEKGDYLFNIEGYYKDLKNILEESQRNTRSFLGQANVTNIYAGTGIAKGIEFLAQKKFGKTTGWICYTLGSVVNNFPDLNYGRPFYANQDQTHEMKAVVNRTVKKWDLSAVFVYATGKPYTAPVSLYQLTMLDGSTSTYDHLYDKNGYRLPAYSRLDIAATYNWESQHSAKHLSFSIFNLLNHQNIWYKEFNPQGYQLNVTNITYLGITPNVSFSIDFR